MVILCSQTDEGSHSKMGRSLQEPQLPRVQMQAERSWVSTHTEQLPGLSVCEGLALTCWLPLVEPKQGAQLLFWSNGTNSGYILQHKRVRKPFCYCKKFKSLLRIAQLIFLDLVLSNTASVSYGDFLQPSSCHSHVKCEKKRKTTQGKMLCISPS